MKNYDVYIYNHVTVKVAGINAEDEEHAMIQADDAVDLTSLFESVPIPVPCAGSPLGRASGLKGPCRRPGVRQRPVPRLRQQGGGV
jgi:hypothetical protein